MATRATELGDSQDVKLGKTPSMLYNNLCGTVPDGYIVAHRKDVVWAKRDGTVDVNALPRDDASSITSVIVNRTNAGYVIATINTNSSTAFWDITSNRQLNALAHDGVHEVRGSTLVEPQEGQLLCLLGRGTGEVWVLDNIFSRQMSIQKLSPHKASITCIATATSGMAFQNTLAISGDISGELVLWGHGPKPTVTLPPSHPSDVVSAIQVFSGMAAVAYGSGLVKILNAETGSVKAEITAHSRWITAMSYCPERNLLATVAEDSLLALWQMPDPTRPLVQQIQLVSYKKHPDCLLTGVAFSQAGDQVAAAAFDVDKLFTYAV